jgi:nucleoside phosphorylase
MAGSQRRPSLTAHSYTVGLIYVKPLEMNAIAVMLDETHEPVQLQVGDTNEYLLGRVGVHNVVIAGPPRGEQGKVAIAHVTTRISLTFPKVTLSLLVGIGGGVPHLPVHDVRLGDVVVGAPEYGPAVVQYDLGKQYDNHFELRTLPVKPPEELRQIVNIVDCQFKMRKAGEENPFVKHLKRYEQYPALLETYRRPTTPDYLFDSNFAHDEKSECTSHDQKFRLSRLPREPVEDVHSHYSTILSGDSVMKSAQVRDSLSRLHYDSLCFEMEAAGMPDRYPCLVIRGICDYSDSHKSKGWQAYAAATAAAYAREVLLNLVDRKETESGQYKYIKPLICYMLKRVVVGTVNWLVPFERNENFVGKENTLKTIDAFLSSPRIHQRVVLWGLGGCGKTATALEYACQTRDQHPHRSVYWIAAISEGQVEAAFREIAIFLKIDIGSSDSNLKELVKEKLSDKSSGEWLVIVDNADVLDILFRQQENNPTGKRLIDYIPRCRHGSVIFTTRTREAAVKLAPPQHIIAASETNKSDAKRILEKSLIQKDQLWDDTMVSHLLDMLACLPLAIIQAAAFMNQKGLSITEYISLLQGADHEIIRILSKDFEDERRYYETKNPVATTWFISFNQIRSQDSLAAQYLALMACIAKDNIPFSILVPEDSMANMLEAIGTLSAVSSFELPTCLVL